MRGYSKTLKMLRKFLKTTSKLAPHPLSLLPHAPERNPLNSWFPTPWKSWGRGDTTYRWRLGLSAAANEVIMTIFNAFWPLTLYLGEPRLGAAHGKALDGTKARGYGLGDAIAPSAASP